MKYALAVLTAIALTSIAAAGECKKACNGVTYADFVSNPKEFWSDLDEPTDAVSCKAHLDRVDVELKAGTLKKLVDARAAACKRGASK